jgi:hypothetical protein
MRLLITTVTRTVHDFPYQPDDDVWAESYRKSIEDRIGTIETKVHAVVCSVAGYPMRRASPFELATRFHKDAITIEGTVHYPVRAILGNETHVLIEAEEHNVDDLQYVYISRSR